MLFEKNKLLVTGKSKFGDNIMILYTTVNLVKLMEQSGKYGADPMTDEILEFTFAELFKSVLMLDNGLWN